MTLTQTEAELMVKRLRRAVQVTDEVDPLADYDTRSFPYATGYSRGAMESVIITLQHVYGILDEDATEDEEDNSSR